jgi:hypothetical protein
LADCCQDEGLIVEVESILAITESLLVVSQNNGTYYIEQNMIPFGNPSTMENCRCAEAVGRSVSVMRSLSQLFQANCHHVAAKSIRHHARDKVVFPPVSLCMPICFVSLEVLACGAST